MITTRLASTLEKDEGWDWAVKNGRIFKVYSPDNKRFDVLLMGQADYVIINVDKAGNYDPKNGELKLFSINGEFRMWVEEGLKGPIRGVRWAVSKNGYDGRWAIGTPIDRLAIEQLMGEYTDKRGTVIDMPKGEDDGSS